MPPRPGYKLENKGSLILPPVAFFSSEDVKVGETDKLRVASISDELRAKLQDKVEESIPAVEAYVWGMYHPANRVAIIAEASINENTNMRLAHIWASILLQGRGQVGALRTHNAVSSTNFLTCYGFGIKAKWCSNGWHLEEFSTEADYSFNGGERLISYCSPLSL